jgi:hypothetical protein
MKRIKFVGTGFIPVRKKTDSHKGCPYKKPFLLDKKEE